jgi:hypothetical protein
MTEVDTVLLTSSPGQASLSFEDLIDGGGRSPAGAGTAVILPSAMPAAAMPATAAEASTAAVASSMPSVLAMAFTCMPAVLAMAFAFIPFAFVPPSLAILPVAIGIGVSEPP